MITAADLYHVLTAVVLLYVAMILVYGSVKWWRRFSPDQCSGINRFIAAGTFQKLIVLTILAIWSRTSSRGCLQWTITLFSLTTLLSTLVVGVPLVRGMCGPGSGGLLVQVVVLQCMIWCPPMLFLFEHRGAKLLTIRQFPDTAGLTSKVIKVFVVLVITANL